VDYVLVNILLIVAMLASILGVIIVIGANAFGAASSGSSNEGPVLVFLFAALVFLACLLWRLWGGFGLGIGAVAVWCFGTFLAFCFADDRTLLSRGLMAALWPLLLFASTRKRLLALTEPEILS
tara:strand:- start:42600 stop:42971 length:372 start_codon:yes stop_codon:yes gene_type:complete